MPRKKKRKQLDQVKVPVSPIKTVADRNALINIFARSPRNLAMFLLGVTCALRIRDLLSLEIRHVLVGGLDKIRITDRIVVREHKTGKVKSFPIHHKARGALRSYLRERMPRDPEEPLFASRKHGSNSELRPISREQAWKIISFAGELAGLPYCIGTHSMRKTFGYLLYQKSKDIALVQKTLNHSNPGHTLRYIGIEQEDIDTAHLSIDL